MLLPQDFAKASRPLQTSAKQSVKTLRKSVMHAKLKKPKTYTL